MTRLSRSLSLVLVTGSLLAPSLVFADVAGPTKSGARISYQAPKSESVPSAPRANPEPSQHSVACACACRRG